MNGPENGIGLGLDQYYPTLPTHVRHRGRIFIFTVDGPTATLLTIFIGFNSWQMPNLQIYFFKIKPRINVTN